MNGQCQEQVPNVHIGWRNISTARNVEELSRNPGRTKTEAVRLCEQARICEVSQSYAIGNLTHSRAADLVCVFQRDASGALCEAWQLCIRERGTDVLPMN